MEKSKIESETKEARPSIKGSIIAPLYDQLLALLDKKELDEFKAELPSEAREILEARPLVSNWYCAESANLLLQHYAKRFAGKYPTDFRQIGRLTVSYNLRTVYKHISKNLTDMENIFSRLEFVWKMFFSSGSVVSTPITKIEPGLIRTEVIVSDWTSHSDALCQALLGCADALARQANVNISSAELSRCISKGDDDCCYVISWRE